MNQILSVNKQNNKNSTVDIKKILIFFAIAILIFGVILIAEGIYGSIKENKEHTTQTELPEIQINENQGKINIAISHTHNIRKVVYYWNSSEQIIKQVNNENNVEFEIDIKDGTNTLTIVVTDELGNDSEYKQEFVYDDTTDRQDPIIELSAISNTNNLKIVAKDETEIDYITYRWNDEEETTIKADENNKNIIEKSIEIAKGKNKLTVIAVDKNNNTTTKEQEFIGLTKANITVEQDGDYLVIKASHEQAGYEEGIKLLEYTLNGKKYKMDFSQTATKEQYASIGVIVEFNQNNKISKIEYRQKMVEGTNRLSVYVYTLQDSQSTFDGVAEN